jgi:outer membrane protein assembly factor BamB
MQILQATGIQGGLIVHIGCGDGRLTAALRTGDSYLVHGLDTDIENVQKARGYIASLGHYGKVSVDHWTGKNLPYIDNLANLVVAERADGVPHDEIMRVLAPRGVAWTKKAGKWERTVKPWPMELDEWTHYLHDPQGTMVGKDKTVGLPRRMQWVGGPKWMRNHDFMASLSAMVSSNGRIFYIIDEGLRNHIYLPGRWVLIARDAFNGTVLWRREIARWFPHTWPFKSGPAYLPRRLVAVDDRVYVTLGINARLSELDAATGETIRTYEHTEDTGEVLVDRGKVYVVNDPDEAEVAYKHASDNRGKERNRVNSEFGWSKDAEVRTLKALSSESGKVLWRHRNRIAPLTAAVKGNALYFHDGEHVVALDRTTGQQRWVSEATGQWSNPATGYAMRMIVGDGTIIVSGQKGARGRRLVGVSAADGKVLWTNEQLKSGHFSPEDVYLINGLVWTVQTGKVQEKGTHFIAVDAGTGEVREDFVAEHPQVFFMHQRCYPGRATEKYIMTSGTGTEILPLDSKKVELHHWLRGACIYGIMPCNGMLYKTPDSCACYYQSKLPHLCAIGSTDKNVELPQGHRLEKGPAYGPVRDAGTQPRDSWPAYRHDNVRSGATSTEVPSKLDKVWQRKIGGKLSTMTAAYGKLFVAAIDEHTVHALDANSGARLWSYMTGGRVDSPPTIWRGRAIFGCADGWVYCVRISDGKLVWRFRAAPTGAKLLSYQQVESPWPVHGSVLIRGDVAYCLAGRTVFLDGGMRLLRLDCSTGKMLSETVLNEIDPSTGMNIQTLIAGKSMPVANPDILSCDDKYIYMAAQRFNEAGERIGLKTTVGKEKVQMGEGRHLFCPTGFLDDAWFHRSYWIYGKNAGEGHGEYTVPPKHTPTGRIMVFDDARAYSLFAQNVGNNINPRSYYTLYAAPKDNAAPAIGKDRRGRKQSKASRSASPGVRHVWELDRPGVHANGMVLADAKLFLAGAPDVADEERTAEYVFGADDELNRQMLRQEKAWAGFEGGVLVVVSAETGRKLSTHKIAGIPVWDGMIAAKGRLYMALQDGSILCMGAGDR